MIPTSYTLECNPCQHCHLSSYKIQENAHYSDKICGIAITMSSSLSTFSYPLYSRHFISVLIYAVKESLLHQVNRIQKHLLRGQLISKTDLPISTKSGTSISWSWYSPVDSLVSWPLIPFHLQQSRFQSLQVNQVLYSISLSVILLLFCSIERQLDLKVM